MVLKIMKSETLSVSWNIWSVSIIVLKICSLFLKIYTILKIFFSFSFYFPNHKVSGKYISTCYLFSLSIRMWISTGMRYAIKYFKFSHFRMIRVKEELVMAPVLQSKFASKATFYLFLLLGYYPCNILDIKLFKINFTIHYRQECEDQGGTESGSCADGKWHSLLCWQFLWFCLEKCIIFIPTTGFGTCCSVVLELGGSSSLNQSYIVQASSSNVDAGQMQYRICPCSSDVCRIRFDFTVRV